MNFTQNKNTSLIFNKWFFPSCMETNEEVYMTQHKRHISTNVCTAVLKLCMHIHVPMRNNHTFGKKLLFQVVWKSSAGQIDLQHNEGSF